MFSESACKKLYDLSIVLYIDPLKVYESFQTQPQFSYFEGATVPEESHSLHRVATTSPIIRSGFRSTNMTARTPPIRDRTPIRHHRTTDVEARSRSRSETLLAYVAEQQRLQQQPPIQPLSDFHFLPSQSAPTTPPIFETPSFVLSTAPSGYQSSTGYYGTLPPQPTSYYAESSLGVNETDNDTLFDSATRPLHPDQMGLGGLNSEEALYLGVSPTPAANILPSMPSDGSQFTPSTNPFESASGDSFRILATRPKPQCWEHGCNGRQFSTFSNLLRHQREKSGNASKATCPHCGTEFTRTTARNGHLYGGKCKGRGDGGAESESGSNDGVLPPT